jgi:hypothetical protein
MVSNTFPFHRVLPFFFKKKYFCVFFLFLSNKVIIVIFIYNFLRTKLVNMFS